MARSGERDGAEDEELECGWERGGEGEKPNSSSSGFVIEALRKVWIWPRGIVIVVDGGARRVVMPSWLEVMISALMVVDLPADV